MRLSVARRVGASSGFLLESNGSTSSTLPGTSRVHSGNVASKACCTPSIPAAPSIWLNRTRYASDASRATLCNMPGRRSLRFKSICTRREA